MGTFKKILLVSAGMLLILLVVVAGKATADPAASSGFGNGFLHPMQSRQTEMHHAAQAQGMNADAMFERLAQWLNMEPEDLLSELESGRTLAEIMREQGLSKNQLHDNLKNEASIYLDQRIAAGDIRQEQKGTLLDVFDQLFEKYSDRILNRDFTAVPEGP